MNQHIVIQINTSQPYNVHIGKGILTDIGQRLRQWREPGHIRLVSDEDVFSRYGGDLISSLTEAGFQVSEDVVAAGEESKSIDTWQWLLNRWAADQLHRSDLVLAFGGGVVGDLTGFAAASYARGIPFVQLPTTLLAAVDSSVGGKTALNLAAGKNLVGAFHQPVAVYCDTSLFASLSSACWQDGLCETVKISVLHDTNLFQRLSTEVLTANSPDLDSVIASAVRHKAHFVCADERDQGLRQQLNLGHTIGHAIERLSDFSISHGQAVAIGLAAISRYANSNDILSEENTKQIIATLQKANLPTESPFSGKAIAALLSGDKKADSRGIVFVVPEAIGRCRLAHIPYTQLETLLTRGGISWT